ncbi:hypothetical protein K3M35_05350 [Rhodococcus sp. DMU2021]|uniref:hypothetical protein n=1 Tax=Rhodococcus sp. DMU2021 TaxID=2866997 RepID=UPI001C7D788B|nr:hypothetical protein [Rhodococcus sp. DMU2021]MBX4168093.1 hypothetical protein [Rhodococcus sp. DMU2021]
MDATGRSYRELSKASGDRVKYQTFHELCTAPPKSWPKNVETIRGMAAALDVSETAVVLGYARSLGVEVQGESMLAQQLPASAGRLTPAQRNAIVSLIRAITTEGTHHGAGIEEEQEPRSQAGGPEHSGEARGDRRRTGAPMIDDNVTALNPHDHDVEPGHHLPAPHIEDALAAREGDPEFP